MMQTDFLPRADDALRVWGENFLSVVKTSGEALPLTPDDLEVLRKRLADFQNTLAAQDAAKTGLRGMTTDKDDARARFGAEVRKLVRAIQGDAAVPVGLITNLGLKPHTGAHSHSAPVAPTKLIAQAASNGVHRLKWNRMGNKPNTTFLIEAQTGADPEWRIAGATTAANFTHSDQIPGVKITYRVRARRAGIMTAPSETAVVYENSPAVLK